MGHTIDVCDFQSLCLGRFSRYVRAFYRCPPFNTAPRAYLDFLEERLRREHYDVLFPVHDQVFLLARCRQRFVGKVGLALPDFAAVEQLQSKAAFARLLQTLALPQPRTTVLGDPQELREIDDYPCYVKLNYSTAGQGVWRVENRENMQLVMQSLPPGKIVVQQAIDGTYHAAQCVFQHGTLVGVHCYRARAVGVGGSAHARESVSHGEVREHAARLGAHLGWHGAMHMEYFCDAAAKGPIYIEANPRIGETFNATLSGANLCELLVRVSMDEKVLPLAPSSPGVRTHALMMSLMGLAERGAGRPAILAELWRAWTGRGVYQQSQDELTRPWEDPWSLLPALVVGLQVLAAPQRVRQTIRRTVDSYALNAEAVRQIAALS
jgi:predicted ATP-grasp superfamily ATP-dependent carboligase